MKQIKKIVLRDATKLTNSQMKEIRGGYAPGNDHSAVCTVQCPAEFGGSSVEQPCRPGYYCDVYSGVYSDGTPYYGAGCYSQNGYMTGEVNLCKLTESLK